MPHRPLMLLAFALVLSSACFDPHYTEGIRCSRQDSCPGDLICDTRDRVCRAQPFPECVRDEDCPRGACDLGARVCIAVCGDGITDTDHGEVCEPSLDGCCNATCDGPAAAGVACRGAAGDCDATESCDGSSTACPIDRAVPDGSACDDCPAGAGLCDECAAGACQDLCGNGVLDGNVGEVCDTLDDAACPGGCQSDCTCLYATSCLDYLMNNPGLPDGDYTIDPDGPGGQPPFTVTCDMSTDGGGFTQLLSWNRELDPQLHTLAALQGALVDEVAQAADPNVSPMVNLFEEPDRVRWADVNATYDVLSWRRDAGVPNQGDVLLDVHYTGSSMEQSAVWFFADAGGMPRDLLCWSDAEGVAGYTAAELALIPYACTFVSGVTFTWDETTVFSLGAPIDAFHLRSLHADSNADASYLYRLGVWVR